MQAAESLREYGCEECARLINGSTCNNIVDALLNWYLLGIGELTLYNYTGNAVKYMVQLYLIASTIITDFNFVDVLIAILSDAFERFFTSRQFYAIKQRAKIFSDFLKMINIKPLIRNSQFLYVKQPIDVNKHTHSWLNLQKRVIRLPIPQVAHIELHYVLFALKIIGILLLTEPKIDDIGLTKYYVELTIDFLNKLKSQKNRINFCF